MWLRVVMFTDILISSVTLLSQDNELKMKTKITQRLILSLQAQEKVYRVHDTLLPGFFIRVLPSGHMSFMVTWGRNKAATLGRVGVLTLEQARTEARRYLTDAHEYGEPLALSKSRNSAAMPTLDEFINNSYEKWTMTHHRDKNCCSAIKASFADLLKLKLNEININRVEKLRSDWLASSLKPSTANRNITRIKGLMSRAAEWGVITENPLLKLRQLKVDKSKSVRYLSKNENERLREALDVREERLRAERESANEWRKERNKQQLADLRAVTFADRLKPLIIILLNTGIRRGEAFNLQWTDVDLIKKVLTIEGDGAKSSQTRHIPLNREALATLKAWKKQSQKLNYVFPSASGDRLDNINKAWSNLRAAAKLEAFRLHDLRHTFASNLAIKGVALNTIRELLGHSDIQMTLRYAHLTPDVKAQAVELI